MPDLATPLLPYVVLYTKPDFNAPDAALFYAQDSDNAERIFEATVPDGEITWVVQTQSIEEAFSKYHEESTMEDL